MSLKIRRVVTGHDDQGRAKVLIDENVSNVISSRPGANSSVIWSSAFCSAAVPIFCRDRFFAFHSALPPSSSTVRPP